MIIKRFTSNFIGMNSVFISTDNTNGILVDPGVFPHELTKIKNYLNKNRLHLEGILFTHLHGDHFSGWYGFQDIDCFAHEAISQIEPQVKEKDLQFIQNIYEKFGYEPEKVKLPGNLQYIEEGELIDVAGNQIVFHSTPGHSAAHSVIILPELNFMLSGDMLIPTTIPLVLHSTNAYLKSLNEISYIVELHQVNQLAPGHANFFHSQKTIIQKIEDEKNYLDGLISKGKHLFEKGYDLDIFIEEMENLSLKGKNNYQHQQNIRTLYNEQ